MNNQVDNSTIKETLSSFYDRNKSPFVITYIITWAVYNWQLWYITFFVSENKLKFTKLQFIYNHFKLNEVIFKPLLYSIGALLIFAIFNSVYDYVLSEFEIRLNKQKQKRDNERFVPKVDYNSLLNELYRLEKINGEITQSKIRFETEIGQLRLDIEQRNTTNKGLIEENKNLTLSSLDFLPYSLWSLQIFGVGLSAVNGVVPEFIFDFKTTQNGFKIISKDREVKWSFIIELMKYKKDESIYLFASAENGIPIFIKMNVYLNKETINERINGNILILDNENKLYDINRNKYREFIMTPFVTN